MSKMLERLKALWWFAGIMTEFGGYEVKTSATMSNGDVSLQIKTTSKEKS